MVLGLGGSCCENLPSYVSTITDLRPSPGTDGVDENLLLFVRPLASAQDIGFGKCNHSAHVKMKGNETRRHFRGVAGLCETDATEDAGSLCGTGISIITCSSLFVSNSPWTYNSFGRTLRALGTTRWSYGP